MNVDLTTEMAEFVAQELASGDYASASELVRDALRQLRRDREAEGAKLEALRRAVALGVADVERDAFSTRSAAEIAESLLGEEEA